MVTGHNTAIVLKFYQAFDDRKIEQALELLAPNFIAHLAGVPEPLNKAGFEQFGIWKNCGALGPRRRTWINAAIGDYFLTWTRVTATYLERGCL